MNFARKLHIIPFLCLAALVAMLSACIADRLDAPDSPDGPEITAEGYNLAFNLDLPVISGGSRASSEPEWEKYEDYVDPRNVHILFFRAQGTDAAGDNDFSIDPDPSEQLLIRWFKPGDFALIPLESDPATFSKRWQAHIHLDPEVDADVNFIKELNDNDFKIAVLANWPDITPSTFSENIDDINVLHHIAVDNYSEAKKGSNPKGKIDVYGFLFDSKYGQKMGATTNWVKSKMKESDFGIELSESEAAGWIRDHWDPSLENNTGSTPFQYDTYSDLWFLWNFGGAADDNANGYYSHADEWEERNGANLRKWLGSTDGAALYDLKEVTDDSASGDSGGSDTTGDGSDTTGGGSDDAGGDSGEEESDSDDDTSDRRNYLRFNTIDGAVAVIKDTDEEISEGEYKKNYGVRLPFAAKRDVNVKASTPGVFSFVARASGKLTIKARHAGIRQTDKPAKLVVQRGKSSKTIEHNFKYDSSDPKKIETWSEDISITGDEERLYIYNASNNSSTAADLNMIDIFEIEYIQDKYLYNTDRIGKNPQELNIPMYGVQKFGALKDVWIPGTVFDLSNFDRQSMQTVPESYRDKLSDIYLLRSVAKVEILIPKSLGAHHVLLRSQNRTARCEPMDVATNTRDIWTDYDSNKEFPDGTHSSGSDCEWTRLIGLTPFNKTTDFDTYQSMLAWYYGSWASAGKVGTVAPASHTTMNAGSKFDDGDYPHIINPHINRSDFTEFMSANKNDDYDRFVLYVPDKFVDDPNNFYDATDNPKVCHIEFRGKDDIFTNLDDNNCYRIYFTKGGYTEFANSIDFKKKDGDEYYNDWEHTYEEDVDNLKMHWPIMRNHVYTFRVEEANKRFISVNLQVLAWKKQSFSVAW